MIPALDDAAVEMVANYSETLSMLETVCHLTEGTLPYLNRIEDFFSMTTHEDKVQIIHDISRTSGYLLSASEIEQKSIQAIHDVVQTNSGLVNTSMELENAINGFQSNLMNTYISLSGNVSALSTEIYSILATTNTQINSSVVMATTSIEELSQLMSSSQQVIDQARMSQEVS